jgi:hypothetical protein
MLRVAAAPGLPRFTAAVMSDLGLVRYLGYAELPEAAALKRRLAELLESETAIVECRCPELRAHRIDPERRLVILDGFFEVAGSLMSESAIEKGVRKLLGGKLARLDRLGDPRAADAGRDPCLA